FRDRRFRDRRFRDRPSQNPCRRGRASGSGPRPGAGRRAPTQGSQHLRGRPRVTRHSAAIPEQTGSGQERNRRRGPTARYVGRTMARTRTSPGRAGLGVVATASLVVIALGLLALVVVGLLNVWNPFGTTTVD